MSEMNELPPKTKRRWMPIVLGIVFLLFVLAVGAVLLSVAWFRQALQVTAVSQIEAGREFDAIRAKFSGQRPLLEMREGEPALAAERKDEARSTAQITRLHLMAWDDDDQQLVTFSLPFWLLRMKSGPIGFSSYDSGFERVSLSAEDIERHGPGLILDASDNDRGRGRVLIWAE